MIIDEFLKLEKAPKNINYKGNLELLKMPKISIVGSRKMSVYTKNCVLLLAKKLSNMGMCIVSGGAIGVDICAAQAAMPNTIAIFANGLDRIYPKSNETTIKNIYEKALALSENENNHSPTKYDFLARNRLVVALSDILIIAQADYKSGSLNSAVWASKLNKELFVLAQRVGESNGTNELIKNNKAKIIYDIDDFCEYIKDKYNLYFNEEKNQDELLEFCKNGANIDEILNKFGDVLYDYELENKVVIDGVLVRSL
ncbi:DNA-processing protein DprA [Campylobacter canadensis]|uniref:DNA-processing protein DprA n=1 Tax=Campylobacter canadensis TaxID=449520 RepID=UPI001CCA2252|nr:DNA-processing protein DprA [Campylobacter canadensis]MBZ8004503.1 DNA-protecting protein DprA [Campylobacter canadensis]